MKTAHYGLLSVRCPDPKMWELVPNNIKKFQKLIKN